MPIGVGLVYAAIGIVISASAYYVCFYLGVC